MYLLKHKASKDMFNQEQIGKKRELTERQQQKGKGENNIDKSVCVMLIC